MTDINSTIIGGGDTSTQNTQVNPLGEFTPDQITRTTGQSLSSYTLSTSAQTIVGAINEILPKATGVGKIDLDSYNNTGEVFNSYTENHAEGDYAHAEGLNTTASGNIAHAEGYYTEANGNYSHAEGRKTVTNNENEHSEGTYNVSNSGTSNVAKTRHSVGIGSAMGRKNAHEIMANGDHYIYGLGGYDGTNAVEDTSKTLQEVINSKQATITAGTGLEFEGNTLNVTLDTTVFKVVSVLPDSPAAGDENKIHLVPGASTGANNAYTEYAWVNSAWEILGEYTSEVDLTPYLKSSDAESTYLKITNAESEYATKTELAGKQNSTDDTLETTSKNIVGAINEILPKATGVGKVDPDSDGTGEVFNSYSGNFKNVASGQCSHAEGIMTTASGKYSHAEGHGTTASEHGSHAEGHGTTASGMYSHAEGDTTIASGYRSHAEGSNTIASNSFEHAEGHLNVSNNGGTSETQTIHSVGIGSALIDRKNAHEIMVNGDHYIYGLGGYDGTNATDISVKTLQRIIEEILINTQHPVIDYSAPDSAFTGTTLINSDGISAVNVWNVENYSRTDIFLLNSSGTTTDKLRYDVVRDTQYSEFQTAHEGDNIEFDEIIQLATIVTNSFAESDLFIYHAKINDELTAKYYLVDIVMTE